MQVLDAVRASERPVVVFDVDSTLLSTAARHLAILRAFAQVEQDPELIELAGTLTPQDFGWTVDAPVRARLHRPAPFYEALERFWFDGFFSSAFLSHDRPTPGALDFVKQVHRAGALVYFLTARNAETMAAGTLQSLHTLGFPLTTGRTVLHLKPHGRLSDKAFKTAALNDIARLGTVVATFENEPANANLFAQRFPDACHVLLDTVCSPGAPPADPTIVRVQDFR